MIVAIKRLDRREGVARGRRRSEVRVLSFQELPHPSLVLLLVEIPTSRQIERAATSDTEFLSPCREPRWRIELHDVSPFELLPEVVLDLDGVLRVLREDLEVGVAVGVPIPLEVPITLRVPIPLSLGVGVVDDAVPAPLAVRESKRDKWGSFLRGSLFGSARRTDPCIFASVRTRERISAPSV